MCFICIYYFPSALCNFQWHCHRFYDPLLHLVNSVNDEALFSVIVFIILLCPASYIQMFSSAPTFNLCSIHRADSDCYFQSEIIQMKPVQGLSWVKECELLQSVPLDIPLMDSLHAKDPWHLTVNIALLEPSQLFLV